MTMFSRAWGNIRGMAKKSPTKKSAAKNPVAQKSATKDEDKTVVRTIVPPPEAKPPAQQNPVFEQAAMIGRNADQHTRDSKRQKAIVEVVLSMAGVNLQNMSDGDGELEQVGVVWPPPGASADAATLVPYHEIVKAFVDQAPYLAQSIAVDDPR